MRKSLGILFGLLLAGGTVSAQRYLITTVAGNGNAGYSGDGGAAASAQLNNPQGVAMDSAGTLYIADVGNYRIRKVASATGIITTVAGNGAYGYSGDGGLATSAQLSAAAVGVAVDAGGNLYIADFENYRIRKVAAATGIITTVAGNGGYGYSGDGGPATSAQIGDPSGVAVDGSGNIYIADDYTRVRMVSAATGIITTVAGNETYGYSGDGGPATSAQLANPAGVALDGDGNLYIMDLGNGVIRKVAAATGTITTVAGNGTYVDSGDGGLATDAGLAPQGLAVDVAGNLYITEYYQIESHGIVTFRGDNRVRRVSASTGMITPVAGNGTYGYSGDGGLATDAELGSPLGAAVDSVGNVYFADNANNVIRKLAPEGANALSITCAHFANFALGQTDASYSVVVRNGPVAAPTAGAVTVTETVPVGLTLASMSGAGWTCSGNTCTRNDILNPGDDYPSITVTVNVAADAPAQVTNQVTVSGGGSPTVSAADVTIVDAQPWPPALASPVNTATGVLVAPTLIWNTAYAATSYDVYFGTLSTPPIVASTFSTSFAPGLLSPGATYYWQIVAKNSFGSTSSGIWSFTTGVAPIGARFIPVTPCRLADTRGAGGAFGGPSVAPGVERSFAIPQGGCGIPATAQAYSLNVTVVPAGPLTYMTLWPTGQPRPVVSTLNSFDGTVVANAAIVPAGAGGAVSVFATAQTDVILDINGYFDSTGAANASSFYAATPCRVADTRNPAGQFGGPALLGGQSRDFPIPLSSCAIPPAASAYSLNVTAVPGTDFLGYLSAWPTGSSRPFVSTLNSWTGRVVANAAIVPVGTNESVSVFVTDPVDVILDINGYFGQAGGAGALSFYPLTPCRVVDTRGAQGAFGGPELEAQTTRSFALPAGGCSVPSNAAAYSLNVTVVPAGALPYLTAWPTGVGQPGVSTLNSFDGSVVANAAIVPAGTNGAVSIYVDGNTQVILDINGYFAP